MESRERLQQVLTAPHDRVARFLVLLAQELTIRARATYGQDAATLADPVRMRAFNEVLHRVTGFLRRVLFSEDVDLEFVKEYLLEEIDSSPIGAVLEDVIVGAADIFERTRDGG